MAMDGKVCIVTGANSGIGRETALGLAQQGAHVVMLVRNEERGNEAKEYVIEKSCSRSIDLMLCDLSSMEQIRRFSKDYREKYNRLDVLINNAGAVISKREQTAEGFEKTFAVNYLAPFLLTQELLPILRSSSPSRVINLTSGLHSRAKVNLENLQSEGKYKGMNAYGSAKLMVVLFTYKMARELEGTGVTCNVVSPGFVATNLGRSSGSRMNSIMFGMMKPFQLSPTEGAETSLYAATTPDLEEVSGRHFAKSQEKKSAEATYDTDLQDELWDTTLKLLG
jgi:NAD(P)-dependent dehydrogenase (short-subunit alcohol dehydrogenase family)